MTAAADTDPAEAQLSADAPTDTAETAVASGIATGTPGKASPTPGKPTGKKSRPADDAAPVLPGATDPSAIAVAQITGIDTDPASQDGEAGPPAEADSPGKKPLQADDAGGPAGAGGPLAAPTAPVGLASIAPPDAPIPGDPASGVEASGAIAVATTTTQRPAARTGAASTTAAPIGTASQAGSSPVQAASTSLRQAGAAGQVKAKGTPDDAAEGSVTAAGQPDDAAAKPEADKPAPGAANQAVPVPVAADRPAPAQPSGSPLPGLLAAATAQASGAPPAGQTAEPGRHPVVEGVAIASVPIEIGLRSLSGTNRFEIRLTPDDLGRVDVRLDIGASGEVKAHLIVERPETLAFLQRDSQHLSRALEQAGLRPQDGDGISLSLRDPGGDPNLAGRDQGDGRGQSRPQAEDRFAGDPAERETARTIVPTHAAWTRASGVDLRI